MYYFILCKGQIDVLSRKKKNSLMLQLQKNVTIGVESSAGDSLPTW